MVSGHEDNTRRKCTYCSKPVGTNFKYSYGMPGMKNVFKCDRWWCTAYQKVMTRIRYSLPWKMCRAVKQVLINHV